MIIYGINPVLEALRGGRVRRLRVGPRGDRARRGRARAGAREGRGDRARRRGSDRSRRARRRAPGDRRRARAAARLHARGAGRGGRARARRCIVVLDGIEDPHNVGAILRTVDAAGAHGVVRQARHAAPLDGVAAKASAGAVAHVRDRHRSQHRARDRGVERRSASGRSASPATRPSRYDAVDFTLPTAIVLGARRAPGCAGSSASAAIGWCRSRCTGAVGSLNVSVAAGVVLFEAARQRGRGVRQKAKGKGKSRLHGS